MYIIFKFTAGLNFANLKINLKSLIKLKEFPFAFEGTKSQQQRSGRRGSMSLCQTDQKIKFTLFLGGNQDSCVRAEEKIGGKLYERRGPWENEMRKEFQIVFLWSFIHKETPGNMNLYPIPVLESSTITVPLVKHFSFHCHVVTGSFHLMPVNQIMVIFKRIHT